MPRSGRRYIDFAAIRRRVSWLDAFEHLGLSVCKEGNEYRACCPMHPDPRRRALAIDMHHGFTCHESDQSGGDVISLVAHVLGLSQYDAAMELDAPAPAAPTPAPVQRRRSARSVSSTVPKKQKGGTNPLDPRAQLAKIAEYLVYEHEAVQALGLSPDEAQELCIGYKPRGALLGTVLIPLRLPDGTPVRCLGIEEALLGKRFDAEPASNVVPLKKRA